MHILYMHINMALRNKMTLKNPVAHTHTLYILYICMVKPHIKNLKSYGLLWYFDAFVSFWSLKDSIHLIKNDNKHIFLLILCVPLRVE